MNFFIFLLHIKIIQANACICVTTHCCPTKMWLYSWFEIDFLLKGNSRQPPLQLDPISQRSSLGSVLSSSLLQPNVQTAHVASRTIRNFFIAMSFFNVTSFTRQGTATPTRDVPVIEKELFCQVASHLEQQVNSI